MPVALTDRLTSGSLVEGRLSESVPVGVFPRLAETLLDKAEKVQVDIRVSRSSSGIPLVEGRLDGRFHRQCQRCLEPVDIEIEAELRLAVTDQDSGHLLPAGFEPWQSDETDVVLKDLVEDELLLALPMAARHPDESQCRGLARRPGHEAPEEAPRRHNPFAVLKDLKQD
jgi:uncharacterized protein